MKLTTRGQRFIRATVTMIIAVVLVTTGVFSVNTSNVKADEEKHIKIGLGEGGEFASPESKVYFTEAKTWADVKEKAEVLVTAESGYKFDKWTKGEIEVQETDQLVAGGTYTATYKPAAAVTFKAGEGGLLKINDSNPLVGETRETVFKGSKFGEIEVPTPQANDGYVFDKWDPAIPAGDTAVDKDVTYTASFKEKTLVTPSTPSTPSTTSDTKPVKETPRFTVTPNKPSYQIGDSILVSVYDFPKDSKVEVWLYSDPTKLGEVKPASGDESAIFTIPIIELGKHKIVVKQGDLTLEKDILIEEDVTDKAIREAIEKANKVNVIADKTPTSTPITTSVSTPSLPNTSDVNGMLPLLGMAVSSVVCVSIRRRK